MAEKKIKSRKLLVWITTVVLASAAFFVTSWRNPTALASDLPALYLRLLVVLAAAYFGGNEASKLIKSIFYRKELDDKNE